MIQTKKNQTARSGFSKSAYNGASNQDCTSFGEALAVYGLELPADVVPGKLYRIAGAGKRASNRSGWCKLFEDGQGGCFGDWSTGLSETWQAERRQQYTQQERIAFARKVAASKAKAKQAEDEKNAQARLRAERIVNLSKPCTTHPYLESKQTSPCGTLEYQGSLVLRVVDFNWNLNSLQFINAQGGKKLLSGGRKRGCFIPIDSTSSPENVIICEGWATGVTLSKLYPAALVLAAIDAGNLLPVASGANKKWPNAQITIAGDDDRAKGVNVGRVKALEAARKTGNQVIFPQWPPKAPTSLSDFNDLACYVSGGEV